MLDAKRKAEILEYINQYPPIKKLINQHLALPYVRDDLERLLLSVSNIMDLEFGCSRACYYLRQFIEASQRCHDDLVRQNLIAADCPWGIKPAGAMIGVTLYLTTKDGREETVFVKSYRDLRVNGTMHHDAIDELKDYALYKIAKRCGVRAPLVKIHAAIDESAPGISKENVYLFATHIAERQEKHPDKRYRFFEMHPKPEGVHLHETENSLISLYDLMPGSSAVTSRCFDHEYKIDRISVARLQLMTKILNLSDLRGSNIGYIISYFNGNIKTKLSVIDAFSENGMPIDTTLPLVTQMQDCWNSDLNLEAQRIFNTITQEDFIAAFTKVEKNFLPACSDILKEVQAMTMESDKRKENFVALIEKWKVNFEKVGILVHAAENALHLNESCRGLSIAKPNIL